MAHVVIQYVFSFEQGTLGSNLNASYYSVLCHNICLSTVYRTRLCVSQCFSHWLTIIEEQSIDVNVPKAKTIREKQKPNLSSNTSNVHWDWAHMHASV